MKTQNRIMVINSKVKFVIGFILLFYNCLIAQTINIYTPEGYRDDGYIRSEWSPGQKASLAVYIDTAYIQKYSLNAVLIDSASNRYACHAYAWQISEGSEDTVDSCSDKYWDDQGVSPSDNLPSYLPQGRFNSGSEADATHSLDEYHSTRKIQNSYPRPIEGGRDYISKWGYAGLYQHAKNHEPYYLGSDVDGDGNPVSHIFKKLKTTHFGTLSTYPKTWVGACGITHTITNNLTVNTTLTIMPGATVNFQNGVTMTVNGTLKVNSNLTIPSGVTLVINPGAVLHFASGVSLTINGTLNAVGNSSSTITFIRSGSSGTWGGIRFNSGSTGNLQYCTILLADYGVYAYNSSPAISNCTIQNCDKGVSCNYYASPSLHHNLIQNNSLYGITCNTYSSPNLTNGTLQSGNVIRNNSYSGVDASYGSNPNLGGSSSGGNSIYGNSNYAITASYSCNIGAKNNWWGVYPVPSSLFSTYSSTVDYSSALNYNPNYRIIAEGNDQLPISGVSYKVSVNDDELDNAIEQQKNKNWEVAIGLFKNIFVKNRELLRGRFSLIKIEECFTQSGRKDFIEYSKKEIKPLLKAEDEMYVVLLELETHQLANNGLYDQAIDNLLTILKKYSYTSEIEKNTLFSLGAFYAQFINDVNTADTYFNELKRKYPDDRLVGDIEVIKGMGSPVNAVSEQYEARYSEQTENDFVHSDKLTLSNYPNPFNPTTTISYTLPEAGNVQIKIFDVLGREVAKLVDETKSAGKHAVTWNGSNSASGIYFYTITFNNQTLYKKMLMIK